MNRQAREYYHHRPPRLEDTPIWEGQKVKVEDVLEWVVLPILWVSALGLTLGLAWVSGWFY